MKEHWSFNVNKKTLLQVKNKAYSATALGLSFAVTMIDIDDT